MATRLPAFNGLFYATVAAIIPVLFLAIAVQGPALRELLGASRKPRSKPWTAGLPTSRATCASAISPAA